ncbi:hypothetical protein P1J78_02920 [Psychromarinibacter sp. C21-152]|uniref:Uncharacterized protein n=1 Tax=Psychromarinibacter sediminicola TaxID=3033385 RepID=A0AAE3NNT0_9RHOB|nr:hypothetical protein [Psychromarinibacter sediminicola]MDF0599676.1 hypothetical protein [Psychromarinibacter sediminicola]
MPVEMPIAMCNVSEAAPMIAAPSTSNTGLEEAGPRLVRHQYPGRWRVKK